VAIDVVAPPGCFAISLSTHTVCYHRGEVESNAYRRSNLWK